MAEALCELSIESIGRGLRSGDFTSEEVTAAQLQRVDSLDDELRAFIRIDADRAISDARRADSELRQGIDRGPLHGVAYGLKDVIDVAGEATTCNSFAHLDYIAQIDSEVARRLSAGGGVYIGKLNTYEFAINGPDPDLPFPPARNPWTFGDAGGGSSTGAAAAVASGMIRCAIGTETGGSIRGPAANCGIVGLHPTVGAVSRRGVFSFSLSLDVVGPLARTVGDCERIFRAVAGFDADDPFSDRGVASAGPTPSTEGVAGLTIGVPRAHFEVSGLSPEVHAELERIVSLLRDGGADLRTVELPPYEQFQAAAGGLIRAEAFVLHRDLVSQRADTYGRFSRSVALGGATVGAADYIDARMLRNHVRRATDAVLDQCDALLTPSLLEPALQNVNADAERNKVVERSAAASATGHPAMTLPTALASSGVPLSVQVAGRYFDESILFRVGRYIEANSGWQPERIPPRAAARLAAKVAV